MLFLNPFNVLPLSLFLSCLLYVFQAVIKQFSGTGYESSDVVVIDEVEMQRHQQLEKLYRSTRAGKVPVSFSVCNVRFWDCNLFLKYFLRSPAIGKKTLLVNLELRQCLKCYLER